MPGSLTVSCEAPLLWSLPLLLVKEDLALVVATLGLCLVLKGAWRIGVTLMALCGAYLAVIVGLVIPSLNPRGQYDFLSVAAGGGEHASLLDTVVHLPVALVSPSVKLTTLLLTFSVVGFLAVRSSFALLAIPIIVTRFASPLSVYWTPYWHYSLPLMTILFIAAIDGIRRMDSTAGSSRQVRRWAASGILAVNVCMLPFFGLQVMADPTFWHRSERAEAFDRITALIPAGSQVQANSSVSVFLVSDHRVYWLTPPDTVVDQVTFRGAPYILVDQSEWQGYDRDGVEYAHELNQPFRYETVDSEQGFTLLARVDEP